MCSYLRLEVVTGKEGEHGGFWLWAIEEVRSPYTILKHCHVSELLSWLVKLRDVPGPSGCQATVPLLEGADRTKLRGYNFGVISLISVES